MIDPVFHPYPQFLSFKEQADPFDVINGFYSNYDLDEAKKWITDCVAFANKKKVWDKGPTTYLLTFYEAMNKLIEANWVIQQSGKRERLADLTTAEFEEEVLFTADFYCNRHYRDDPWADFPRSLKRKEYLNPYIVFERFFAFCGLATWKEYLYDILHSSLSGGDVICREHDIMSIKEHLNKLIEANHLIHIREYEYVDHHLQPKTKLSTSNSRMTKKPFKG